MNGKVVRSCLVRAETENLVSRDYDQSGIVRVQRTTENRFLRCITSVAGWIGKETW